MSENFFIKNKKRNQELYNDLTKAIVKQLSSSLTEDEKYDTDSAYNAAIALVRIAANIVLSVGNLPDRDFVMGCKDILEYERKYVASSKLN